MPKQLKQDVVNSLKHILLAICTDTMPEQFKPYHTDPIKCPKGIAFYKKGELSTAKNVVNQQLPKCLL